MKKLLFSILFSLGAALAFSSEAKASEVVEPKELVGEAGYPSFLDIYLYVSDENNRVVNTLYFYELDTGAEYYCRFNNYNFDDEFLWIKRVNIPNGRYDVYSITAGDDYGVFRCYTEEDVIVVENESKPLVCLIGRGAWLEENGSMLSPTEAPTITPTVAPTPTPLPELPVYVEPEAPQENPEEEKGGIPKGAIAGGIILVFVALLFLKKRR